LIGAVNPVISVADEISLDNIPAAKLLSDFIVIDFINMILDVLPSRFTLGTRVVRTQQGAHRPTET
jgi:hypothetical protein